MWWFLSWSFCFEHLGPLWVRQNIVLLPAQLCQRFILKFRHLLHMFLDGEHFNSGLRLRPESLPHDSIVHGLHILRGAVPVALDAFALLELFFRLKKLGFKPGGVWVELFNELIVRFFTDLLQFPKILLFHPKQRSCLRVTNGWGRVDTRLNLIIDTRDSSHKPAPPHYAQLQYRIFFIPNLPRKIMVVPFCGPRVID